MVCVSEEGEIIYRFRAQNEEQAAAWLLTLRDESNCSARRMAAVRHTLRYERGESC
eukprot:COSAG01_NODE_14506_length_1445_cov_2.125557_3_plen_56_part_00